MYVPIVNICQIRHNRCTLFMVVYGTNIILRTHPEDIHITPVACYITLLRTDELQIIQFCLSFLNLFLLDFTLFHHSHDSILALLFLDLEYNLIITTTRKQQCTIGNKLNFD